MKNILLICQKELKSYFASPIAYAVMAFFGLIFGFGFYTATRDFVRFSFQAQMMGQSQPMNVNEQIIRPLLGFAGTIALFLIPMITMRLFAEEKRTGTIELLLTSPVQDIEIILGKWLGAMAAVRVRAGHVGDQHRAAVRVGQAGPEAGAGGVPGAAAAGRVPAGDRRRSSPPRRKQPDHRRRRHLLCVPAAVAAELVHGVRQLGVRRRWSTTSRSSRTSRISAKGVLDSKDVVFYLS